MALSILLISSCGTVPLQIEEKKDFLAQESLARRTEKELDKNQDYLSRCRLGKNKEVLQELQTVVEKKQNSYWYWNTVASCYLLQKDFLKARLYYQTAQSFADNNKAKSIINNNLGVSFDWEGRYYQAHAYYSKAYDLNQNSSVVMFNLANLLLKHGQYEQAEKLVQKMKIKSPQDPELLHAEGSLQILQSDFAAAATTYRKIASSFLVHKELMNHYMLAEISAHDVFDGKSLNLPAVENSKIKIINEKYDDLVLLNESTSALKEKTKLKIKE